jgi:hypothetical protein
MQAAHLGPLLVQPSEQEDRHRSAVLMTEAQLLRDTKTDGQKCETERGSGEALREETVEG